MTRAVYYIVTRTIFKFRVQSAPKGSRRKVSLWCTSAIQGTLAADGGAWATALTPSAFSAGVTPDSLEVQHAAAPRCLKGSSCVRLYVSLLKTCGGVQPGRGSHRCAHPAPQSPRLREAVFVNRNRAIIIVYYIVRHTRP